MSVDYYVNGFKPASEKCEKMRKVWETCKEANIKVFREVCDFFGGECPEFPIPETAVKLYSPLLAIIASKAFLQGL